MLLDSFLPDAVLQAIAAENNLSETAFLVRAGDDYKLRWLTPEIEVPLCGHATLASSAVIMERLEPGRKRRGFPHGQRTADGGSHGRGIFHGFSGAAFGPRSGCRRNCKRGTGCRSR